MPALMRLRRVSQIAAASMAEWADTIASGSPLAPWLTVTKEHESVSSEVTAWS